MSTNLNITAITDEIQERLPSMEHAIGKGGMQPFANTNSGTRKIMNIIQNEQKMQLERAEPAIISTGAENLFGELSSSFVRAEANYTVIEKISKFPSFENQSIRNSNYWVILLDAEKGVLHTEQRVDYRHITESYGYRMDNSYLDELFVGDCIPKGTPIKKSSSFDHANNKADGINLTTIYVSTALTTDDPIVISESAARKFAAPLFSPVKPVINDNDILLNLYGDNDNYKTFPDIGEEVKNGIVCAVRRERKDDEALYSQSWERLKDIMISDEKYIVKGKVIDINVFCNNPEKLQTSIYNKQIAKYYNMNKEFCLKVVTCVSPLLETGIKMSYDMQTLFYNCERVLNGTQYINEKVFNNIILEIIVMETIPLKAGDKITNRFGGKGVISKVEKDENMPQYFTRNKWEPIDALYNLCTVVNRENPGQLIEVSINHASDKLLERIEIELDKELITLDQAENMIYRFLNCVVPNEAEYYRKNLLTMCEEERISFMQSILWTGNIYISTKPISDKINIDTIRAIYKEFPWIEMSDVKVPIEDSNGNLRYIMARRKLVTGKQYIYRLKQFAEEKFSAVSLASTNIRSENTKSKMNKLHKAVHASTPVRFGEMELEDLLHMPIEEVIQVMMLLSTSPLARRLHQQLLIGNPFDIDIKLDKDSTSRSVEIVNAYLKTAGLRLVFDKIPKKKKNTALRIIATRIPGKIGLAEAVRRVPEYLRGESITDLIKLYNDAYGIKEQIAHRVPSNVTTQEEAQSYIKEKETSQAISTIMNFVDETTKTKEDVEKRIVNKSMNAKNQSIVNRHIIERHPDNWSLSNKKQLY